MKLFELVNPCDFEKEPVFVNRDVIVKTEVPENGLDAVNDFEFEKVLDFVNCEERVKWLECEKDPLFVKE